MLKSDSAFMIEKRPAIGMMPYSDLAGNASFVLSLAAFAMSDMLALRLLTITAIGSGIAFQYYRLPEPLWIPIRWNFLIIGINVAMVGALAYERRRAESMPDDLERIYREARFEERGFTKVEFCRLFGMGRRTELPRGYVLARDGRVNDKLYLLLDGGTALIEKRGRKVASVPEYHFVNEMSFLLYRYGGGDSSSKKTGDDSDDGNASRKRGAAAGTEPHQRHVATADAKIDSPGRGDITECWVWSFDELKKGLESDREVSNAWSSYLNHDLRNKLVGQQQSES